MQIRLFENRLLRASVPALGIIVLLVWPFAAVSILRNIPTNAAMGLWGLSYISAMLLLMHLVMKRRRAKGLGRGDVQAGGLAGKNPGMMAPRVVIPLVFLFVSGVCARNVLRSEYLLESAISFAANLFLLSLLLSAMWKSKSQRQQILLRIGSDTERVPGNHGSAEEHSSSEAIEFIGRVLDVPPHAILKSDRFGYEIGQWSHFDQTLDVIGGRLILLQRQSGRALELSKIKTVGEFSAEWSNCKNECV
jgi:hypothetical protein